MLYRPKVAKGGYNIVLDKVRYYVPPYIWVELTGNKLRLWNRLTGTYHLFESGRSTYTLKARSLRYMMERIEREMKRGDEFRRDIKTG